jgi:UDP-glucose 4-epimerase
MTSSSWKQVLVTGGAGAIGSTLSNALASSGCSVTVLDDLSSGNAELLQKNIRFVQGSICNEQDLVRAFAGGPEVVFHLAALFANQNSVDHPITDISVNGAGTINVLEQCMRSGVRKLLYTSSSCVYGSSADMREESPVGNIDTPYAITKLLGEQYCRFWTLHHRLDTVIVRIFNTYGPGEFPGPYRNVIPNFFDRAFRGEPLPITGSGEEVRDFNYVEDTVSGIIGAMKADTVPGDIFNLASGTGTRIIDLAVMVNEIAGSRGGVVYQPRRSWDSVTTRIGVVDKARGKLQIRPQVGLREGLKRTGKWLRSVPAQQNAL